MTKMEGQEGDRHEGEKGWDGKGREEGIMY